MLSVLMMGHLQEHLDRLHMCMVKQQQAVHAGHLT